MKHSPEQLESARPEERRKKRRAVVAFSLAAVAVLGIGAAATSAAWTDNVFFSAPASAATFDIKGSFDPALPDAQWKDSNDKTSIQLAVPATTFQNLTPGTTRTVDLYVKNFGNVATNLVASVAGSTPAVFTNLSVTLSTVPSSLAAGATQKITLTVAAPATWDQANVGKSDTYIVTIASQLGS
ncbi:hypothetical protein WDJ51_08965 [Rathayibacter sp. YIM 133350]|uniref:hypothetical protein n=1 Tax=Rathayibacter sp. YIM 133350 TaxID=3131992 RepID=UPI00307D3B10